MDGVPSEPLSIEQILTLLADGPRHIARLTDGVPPDRLHAAPEVGEWSANEILAHLRACSDVWGGNILRILAEDQPRLRGMHPRVWMRKTDYPDLEFGPSFAAYTSQRSDLMTVLDPLPSEAWERAGSVRDTGGQVVERSALFYADKLARHEQTHVEQIERIHDNW